MAHASFDGLRVLSLESRRAKEIEKLIRTYGGEAFVVSAMREVKLESNRAALEFARKLIAGEIDAVLFTTGVGVRSLMETVSEGAGRDAFLQALKSTRIVGAWPQTRRGRCASSASSRWPSPPNQRPGMNCCGTVETTFNGELHSLRLAVQEYGASNPDLLAALSERAASVLKVPVYTWELPLDLKPLRETVHGIAHAQVDVLLFTTAVQVVHLMIVAQEMNSVPDLMRGMRHIAIVSIGPTTSAELLHYGIAPDFEPSRPKLRFLVSEAAQYAKDVLQRKRELAATLGFDLLPAEQPAGAPCAGCRPGDAACGQAQCAQSRRVHCNARRLHRRFEPVRVRARDQPPHRLVRSAARGARPHRGVRHHDDPVRLLLHLHPRDREEL